MISTTRIEPNTRPGAGGRGPEGKSEGGGAIFLRGKVVFFAPKIVQGWFLTVSSTIPTFFRKKYFDDRRR